jgi:uncharacterized membrane protein
MLGSNTSASGSASGTASDHGWRALLLAELLLPGLALAQAERDTIAPLSPSEATRALSLMLAVAMLLGGVAWALVRRQVARGGVAKDWWRTASRVASPLLIAPMVPLWFEPEHAQGRAGVVMLSILVFAGLTIYARTTVLPGDARTSSTLRPPILRPRTAKLTLTVAAIAVTIVLGRVALLRHQNLQSNVYDLGLFSNALWNTAHGRFMASTFLPTGTFTSEHITPTLALLAPLHWTGFGTEAMLLFSCAFLVSGVIPVYLLATREGGPGMGLALGLAYLGCPALHANALWDFHELSISGPVMLWLIWAVLEHRTWLYWITLSLLLGLREDLAFAGFGIALWLVLLGQRRAAAITVALCVVSLACAVAIMPDTGTHLDRYKALMPGREHGTPGLLWTIALQPTLIASHVMRADKLLFLFSLALPTLGAAVLAPRARVLLLFGLALTLLSSSRFVHHLYFHYNSTLYPVLFACAPAGLVRMQTWLAQRAAIEREHAGSALALGVFAAALGTCLTYGGLHRNPVFSTGFDRPARSLDDAARERIAWLHAQLDAIPQDAIIATSGRVGAHLADRPGVRAWFDAPQAEYMLVLDGDLRDDQVKLLDLEIARRQLHVLGESHGLRLIAREPEHP